MSEPFRAQSGRRYEPLAPSFAALGDVRATQVRSEDGDGVLVELPESFAIETLRTRERSLRDEPHVLAARHTDVLAPGEPAGTTPYRGAAHGEIARHIAVFPARRGRSLGWALSHARDGEAYPPRVVVALALECARGLALTEELGLLTPASIVIDGEASARVRGPILEALATRARMRDDPGATRWLRYRAPELLRPDAQPTPAARLFALGAMLFELLGGRALFAASGAAAAQQIARWSVSMADTMALGAEVPSELRSVVWSLLQREPDRRASPHMIIDVLSALYDPDPEAGALLAPDASVAALFGI